MHLEKKVMNSIDVIKSLVVTEEIHVRFCNFFQELQTTHLDISTRHTHLNNGDNQNNNSNA